MRLKISNLSKTYPNGVKALKNLSLDISTGLFGLLGPNGAGKSSLMRTIATLQEADEGSVFLDDLDVLKDKDGVRRILGYLPQEFGVYPKMSALDLLDHVAVMKGVTNRGERKGLVEGLLRQTNLYDVRKKSQPVCRFDGRAGRIARLVDAFGRNVAGAAGLFQLRIERLF